MKSTLNNTNYIYTYACMNMCCKFHFPIKMKKGMNLLYLLLTRFTPLKSRLRNRRIISTIFNSLWFKIMVSVVHRFLGFYLPLSILLGPPFLGLPFDLFPSTRPSRHSFDVPFSFSLVFTNMFSFLSLNFNWTVIYVQ